MAFNIEKDIFEPTMRSIEKMNKASVCSYCKTTVGFSHSKCATCGAPSIKPVNKQPEPRKAGPGRLTSG